MSLSATAQMPNGLNDPLLHNESHHTRLLSYLIKYEKKKNWENSEKYEIVDT